MYKKKTELHSINGKKCLGECVPKNTFLLHPITLEYLPTNKISMCAINPTNDETYIEKNIKDIGLNNDDVDHILKKYNQKKTLFGKYAPCVSQNEELKSDYMETPKINFDSKFFLNKFYKLYSIENVVSWIGNHKNAYWDTQKRLINCAWNAYASDKKNITDIFVEFYLDIIRDSWMESFYDILHLHKYVNSKIQLTKVFQKDKDKDKDKKVAFLADKLFTHIFVRQTIFSYIDKNIGKWYTIFSHHDEYYYYLYGPVLKKINKLIYRKK